VRDVDADLQVGDRYRVGNVEGVGDAVGVVVRDRPLRRRVAPGRSTRRHRHIVEGAAQRSVTVAPLADTWSMLRCDGVPSHNLLDGVVSSAKRAAAPRIQVVGIAARAARAFQLEETIGLLQAQFVVRRLTRRLVAVARRRR
jgi:hypothetical protein